MGSSGSKQGGPSGAATGEGAQGLAERARSAYASFDSDKLAQNAQVAGYLLQATSGAYLNRPGAPGAPTTGAGEPDAFRMAMADLAAQKGGHLGGCDCPGFFGGDAGSDPAQGLHAYEDSMSANAKESVIRRLGVALNNAGLKITDPETVDTDVIVKQLVEQIPNPRNRTTFARDAASQEKVCRVVADVLNAQYSPGTSRPGDQFIDVTLGPVAICRKVGEWAHSFASGVNTEFLSVHASLRNTLYNVRLLDEVMKRAWAQMRASIESGSCGVEVSREIDRYTQLYEAAQQERTAAEEVLNNILHAQLPPAAEALEVAMRDITEKNALIQRIGLRADDKPGTSVFANNIAESISGLGTAAVVANRVHKALQKVGATVDEYLRATDEGFLKKLDSELLSRRGDKNWAEIIEAMETLRAAFSGRQEKRFAEALRADPAVTGGAPSVDERVKRQQVEKDLIVNDFTRRLTGCHNEIIASLRALAPELGRKIPLGDSAEALRDSLQRLGDVDETHIESALIGLYSDAPAREKKSRYLADLRLVASACSALLADDAYRGAGPLLTRVKSAIDMTIQVIDLSSDIVVKRFGGEAEASDEAYFGGAGEIPRSSESLHGAVSEFAYFYYIAKVRENFRQVAEETVAYGEKYEDLLGDAIAGKIQALERDRAIWVAYLGSAENRSPLTGFPPGAAEDKLVQQAIQFVNQEYDAKIRLYRSLEAIDLYLKAFTAGIVSDPDAVKDIKVQLEGAQVIARWFNEQTGDAMWHAFERMPYANQAGGVTPNTSGAALLDSNAKHYYDRMKVLRNAGTAITPGIPECGVPLDKVPALRQDVSAVYDNFQALKNLLSAFMRLGATFGGKELRSQVFMSPTQLYKNLMDYLKQSALSLNLTTVASATAAAAAGASATFKYVPPQLPNDHPSSRYGIPEVVNAVKPGDVFFGSVGGETTGNFVETDLYFMMAVKAIAAKVMTALGVYDMFDRRTPLRELDPTRMALGGSGETPAALVGATELYFRLPRLLEFYRNLRWDGESSSMKVAMLPEIEGVFSGLFRTIFTRMANPQTGDYTESELHEVIREVNHIWTHFNAKSGDRATQDAVSALVLEVNRRIGVVKGEDMKKYWSLLKNNQSRKGNSPWQSANSTNYAILPGEGDQEYERRAPSDRYVRGVSGPRSEAAGRVGLDDMTSTSTRWLALRQFRNDVTAELTKHRPAAAVSGSFSIMLKQAKARLAGAATPAAKLSIAMELVQGTEHLSTEQAKIAFFNETVVVGLDTLNAIERYLSLFEEAMNDMSMANRMRYLVDRLQTESFAAPAAPAAVLTKAQLANRPAYALTPDTPSVEEASINPRWILPRDPPPGGSYESNPYYVGRAGAPQGLRLRDVLNFVRLDAADVHALAPYRLSHTVGAVTTPIRASELLGGSPQAVERRNALTPQQREYFDHLCLAARLLMDTDLLMSDFIETLFALHHSTGGLIEVKITALGEVQLGYARLREMVDALMADVTHYIELFRGSIPPDRLKIYEGSVDTPGSLYWLEHALIDRRFLGTVSDATDPTPRTLDVLSRMATRALKELNEPHDVAANPASLPASWTGATFAMRNVVDPAVVRSNRVEQYGRALARLVYWDVGTPDSGAPRGAFALDNGFALGSLIRTARPAGPGALGIPQAFGPAAGALVRLGLYETTGTGGMLPPRSLMEAFNQILARYLSVLSEPSSSHRIYTNLIMAFVNGPAARSVTKPSGNSFPDIGTEQFMGQRGDPMASAILYESLALVLGRLVTDVNPSNQMADHLIATLTDVPPYLKESYRANLPGFVRLFDLLIAKGEFIKQFIQKTATDCGHPSQLELASRATGMPVAVPAGTRVVGRPPVGAAVVVSPNGFTEDALDALRELDGGKTSDAMAARLIEILDAVSASAYSLSTSAGEVLRELGDQPAFCQMNEGFIETYRLRQGKMPLMPLSFALSFLRNLEVNGGAAPALGGGPAVAFVDDTTLFPKFSLGETPFKLQYGVRGLLVRHGPVTFEQMPGVKSALDDFNGSSSRHEAVDPERFLEFDRRVIEVLRWLTESRQYKSAIGVWCENDIAPFNARPLLHDTAAPAPGPWAQNWTSKAGHSGLRPSIGGAQGNVTWALLPSSTTMAITSAIESTNQEGAIAEICRVVLDKSPAHRTGSNRGDERVLNLVDLNIVPINPNAFMRDVPLANIYNYEYAFDQFVATMYGEDPSRYAENVDVTEIRNAKDLFLQMLCDPYIDFAPAGATKALHLYGSGLYDLGTGGMVHRVFRGDNDLGLGRPKFLSDQLFNKALLGSVVPRKANFDEAGPSVSSGVARGRAAVGTGPWRPVFALAQRLQKTYETLYDEIVREIVTSAGAPGGATFPNIRSGLTSGVRGVYRAAVVAALNTYPARAKFVNLVNSIVHDYEAMEQAVYDVCMGLGIDPVATPIVNSLLTRIRSAISVAAPPTTSLIEYNRINFNAVPDAQWSLMGVQYALGVIWGTPPFAAPAPGAPAGVVPAPAGEAMLRIFAYFLSHNIDNNSQINVNTGGLPGSIGYFSSFTSGTRAQDLSVGRPVTLHSLEAVVAPAGRPADVWASSSSSGPTLTFVQPDDPAGTVEEFALDYEDAVRMEQIGRARFDTRAVRDLYFITNVLRVVRLKLNRELTQSRKVVVASHVSVAPGVTEYGTDPFTPNETQMSLRPNGFRRFDDEGSDTL